MTKAQGDAQYWFHEWEIVSEQFALDSDFAQREPLPYNTSSAEEWRVLRNEAWVNYIEAMKVALAEPVKGYEEPAEEDWDKGQTV